MVSENMIRFLLDNMELEIDSQTSVAISLSFKSRIDLLKRGTGYTKTIRIPITTENRKIIGDIEQENSIAKFNGSYHEGLIEVNGCTIMRGNVQMISCVRFVDSNHGYYQLRLTGTAKEWVDKISTLSLQSVSMDFNEKITSSMISESWTWTKPVRFLPVQRGILASQNAEGNLIPPVKVLSFEDYHPFINVNSLVHQIFLEAGYTVKSGFMQGGFFQKLYISGNYHKADSSLLRTKMDFKAGRFENIGVAADSLGRVYADPYRTFNSIGNIVQTADPEEEFNGQGISGLYNNGGCFQMDDDRISFVPSQTVTMSFRYRIFYTTDYYIVDREELKGINAISLDDGQLRRYKIANRFADRKESLRTGREYMVIVFDHREGVSYQLNYDEIINQTGQQDTLNSGNHVERMAAAFSDRTERFVINGPNPVRNPQLWFKTNDLSEYSLYKGDWAIYDAYVMERGQIDIELDVRSTAETITPSKRKLFDMIYFEGAEEGMRFTLHSKTSVTPVFAEYPSEGSMVGFSQIAVHDISCLEFINSLKHLFNLHFHTDPIAKTVYIEPGGDFYRNDIVVDWSDKIDLSRPIIVSEPGDGMSRKTVFKYRGGDSAVSKWNQSNGESLGQWEAEIDNVLASASSNILENPLYAASITISGQFPDARSAKILQVGDSNVTTEENNENLNFPCKIVGYAGMTSLPPDERWGWPSNGSDYPMTVFNDPDYTYQSELNGSSGPEEGFSLCFEDRNGIAGLNRFWRQTFETYNVSKRIELYIMLRAEDVEPFICIDDSGRDFRALFRLEIEGESSLYRLEEICDYDPSSAKPTKCIFIQEK